MERAFLSEWMAYLQYLLGASRDPSGAAISGTSWSAQLQASERLWMLLEGGHVLGILLFGGTIFFVDLRLLGVAFRETAISKISDALLPYTIAGFAIMVVTGSGLFFANPLEYYHNFVFRLKAVFLLLAALNIFVFYGRVHVNRAAWDDTPVPPRPVRVAAGSSLALWLLVIVAGRYAAYDWTKCERATGFVASAAQCQEHDATLAQAEASLVP